MASLALFKDNLIANKREVTYDEIYLGFIQYPMFKKNYPKNITFENCLLCYISNADGLSSTFENSDFEDLKNYCLMTMINSKILERRKQHEGI